MSFSVWSQCVGMIQGMATTSTPLKNAVSVPGEDIKLTNKQIEKKFLSRIFRIITGCRIHFEIGDHHHKAEV